MSVRARGLDWVPGSFLLSQRPGSTRLEVYFRGNKSVNEDAIWLTISFLCKQRVRWARVGKGTVGTFMGVWGKKEPRICFRWVTAIPFG